KAKIIEIKIDISGSEDETRKKANEALTKIKSGEGFENVAKRYSNGNSSDAYFIKRGEKGPGFEDKVFNLQTNEVSSIFKDGNSFYIIKVVEKQDRRQRPFSEVIDEIKAEAIKEKMNEQYELRKSEALFSIHGKTFTLGEFIAEFNELSPETQSKFKSIEAKKDLIEQVIAKQLLLEEAGDDSGDSVSDEEIEELKSQYISQILHKEEIDEKMSKITNEEAKKFYEENKKQFIDPLKAEISLIRVELGKSDAENTRARQKIDEALQKIKAGADFATIAKEYSEDFTASVGGEINEWIYDDDYLDPLLKKKIFSLQTGQVSNVFEYEGGYYIFKLRKKEEERQRNFDEVEEQIKEGLLDEKHHIREAELEDELLAKSQLLIYNSSLRKMLKEQSNNKK
ncbi:peptidylprolyl isomerase, partial [Anaerosolibacter sp.]|uniref:peptidylprolyl isomerase n=1 Tax=Anaerosolibacter sp. TaxID=1872527 RepID=UPI0039EFFFE4